MADILDNNERIERVLTLVTKTRKLLRKKEAKIAELTKKLHQTEEFVNKLKKKEEHLRDIFDECYRLSYDNDDYDKIKSVNTINKAILENTNKKEENKDRVMLPDYINEI